MPTASDSQTNPLLVEAVRDLKNQEAWAAFSRRYEGVLRACCLKQGLRADAAEELTQAVLVKLVEAMPTFVYDNRRGRFRNWLRTLVRSAVVDHRRRQGRRPGDQGSGDTAVRRALANLPDRETLNADKMADALAEQYDRAQRVREACDRIKTRVGEQTWRAFWLKTVDGLPGVKIAEQLGMTVGAVYQAGSRVRSMIEKEIGDAP